ncbi:MAG: adenylate kinase [Luteitalea sp.]|nr:adenylate kinase [Luteitalea sp.]
MLGPPGAGKGTQGERLAREYGVPRIATGDILREAVAAGTDLGRLAKATMEAGQLVGDEVMIEIVRERLSQPDTRRGFVLDGFPRTVGQAEALDALVSTRGVLTVLHIVVPLDELARRVASRRICAQCGANAGPLTPQEAPCAVCGGTLVQRTDDSVDVVRKRLHVFEIETAPLVKYYRPRSTFFEIDGNQSPDHVSAAMRTAIGLASEVSGAARGASYRPSAADHR